MKKIACIVLAAASLLVGCKASDKESKNTINQK